MSARYGVRCVCAGSVPSDVRRPAGMQLAFDGAAVYALQISEQNGGNAARRGHIQLGGSRSLSPSPGFFCSRGGAVEGEDKGTY